MTVRFSQEDIAILEQEVRRKLEIVRKLKVEDKTNHWANRDLVETLQALENIRKQPKDKQ